MLEKNAEKIIVGAALAAAASTLLPIAKAALRPLADSVLNGAAGLINRAQAGWQIAREEFEDIVAEAQFERMKKQLDQDIAVWDAEEPETTAAEQALPQMPQKA